MSDLDNFLADLLRENENLRWKNAAHCRGMDPESFFPDKSGAGKARAVCANCPVRLDCLEFAISEREIYGVWGGCPKRVRDRVRRRMLQRNVRSVKELLRGPGGPEALSAIPELQGILSSSWANLRARGGGVNLEDVG